METEIVVVSDPARQESDLRRAADVLRILPEVLFHHHILVGVVPAEGHPVRKSLLHVQRQQLIQIFRFM